MVLQVADSKADIYTWRNVNYLQSKSRVLGRCQSWQHMTQVYRFCDFYHWVCGTLLWWQQSVVAQLSGCQWDRKQFRGAVSTASLS